MFETIKIRFRALIPILAIMGPGIITAAVDNDAGGITTYSVAGAHFGYSMLWTMIPITIVLIVVQEMCARMGIVSGKGLSDLIRESYGARITFYMLLGLIVANLSTIIAEFSGIAGSMEIFNVPRYVSVPFAGILVWLVIAKGSYHSVEKFFLVASLLYFAYIISGYLAKPDWSAVGEGFIKPHFEFSKNFITMIVGLIGTTVTPWMQFYLQSSVVEKGVKVNQLKYTRFDVISGSVISNLIAASIIIASAATLFSHGVRIEQASDAARALAPFAGQFAEILFAVGLLNASLLGAMIVSISTSYFICEGLGFEGGVDKTIKEAPAFYGIFTALVLLGIIPAIFPQTPLIKVMLVSQVINGILLAPILIFIALLINKKWLMGDHVNRSWYNVIVWLTVIVLIALSFATVVTSF